MVKDHQRFIQHRQRFGQHNQRLGQHNQRLSKDNQRLNKDNQRLNKDSQRLNYRNLSPENYPMAKRSLSSSSVSSVIQAPDWMRSAERAAFSVIILSIFSSIVPIVTNLRTWTKRSCPMR